MSVQLILYPQGYNPLSLPVFNEFLVDGISFLTVSAAASTTVSTTPINQGAVNYFDNAGINPNTFGRFKTAATGAQPAGSSGTLQLQIGESGLLQKLSNLTPGNVYNVALDVGVAGSNTITLNNYNGTVQAGQDVGTGVAGSILNLTFTAASSDDYIVISANTTALLVISNISIKSQIAQPSGATNLLANGQVICDLYEEEDIPLTLSVDNFKNVAEKVQSYSKDFNLPATKRNNQIFNNIFDITRNDNGLVFNPYVKTQCILKQDGYILFEGYLRLIDITTDAQKEISYNVNLYSEVIALADMLKNKTFNNMSFEELQHTYNITQIQYSWNDSGTGITYSNSNVSGFRDEFSTLKYPFVDWKHQTLISNGTNGTIDNPEIANLNDNFRPFINCKYLIDRIFQDTELFSYTSTFFDDADFQKLYVDFNWGDSGFGLVNEPMKAVNANTSTAYGTSFTTIDLDGIEDGETITASDYYNTSTNTFTAQSSDTEVSLDIHTYQLGAGSNNLIIWQAKLNGTVVWTGTHWISTTNSVHDISTPIFNLDSGDTITVEIKFNSGTPTLASASYIQYNIQSEEIDFNQGLLNFRGDMGQYEFLKGIMTMFNLVSLPDPDNPNNIIIETYEDVFNPITSGTTLEDRSIAYDWTDKIDEAKMKLTPLTDLNRETIFKFVEDDDDYTFNLYKASVKGHLYGSKKAFESEYTLLEGTKEIVAEPFAATVVKPLFPQFEDFITPAIFTSNEEATEFEGFENSPRIMYNNGKKTLSSCTYYIPAFAGVAAIAAETEFLQFSHLSGIATAASTLDYHFGECQLINPVGQPSVNNLFNLYWKPYYGELYNPDTRTMTIKVDLTPSDINIFKFSDIVMIKNRAFRVNKIDYKPNALATVEFILIP